MSQKGVPTHKVCFGLAETVQFFCILIKAPRVPKIKNVGQKSYLGPFIDVPKILANPKRHLESPMVSRLRHVPKIIKGAILGLSQKSRNSQRSKTGRRPATGQSMRPRTRAAILHGDGDLLLLAPVVMLALEDVHLLTHAG